MCAGGVVGSSAYPLNEGAAISLIGFEDVGPIGFIFPQFCPGTDVKRF